MTGPIPTPDAREVETRPISVAELLAKNGTIGAPPVTGRRRRRKGNADAITVAELTGEIPVIRDDEPEPGSAAPAERPAPRDDRPATGRQRVIDDDRPATGRQRVIDDGRPITGRQRVMDDDRPVTGRQRALPSAPRREPEPRWPKSPPQPNRGTGPEHSHYPRPQRRTEPPAGAERMRPDPADNFTDIDVDVMDTDVREADLLSEDSAFVRSFLIGGPDGAERSGLTRPALAAGLHDDDLHADLHDADLADELHDEDVPDLSGRDDDVDSGADDEHGEHPGLTGYAMIVLQSVLAVVLGGGLFVGFDQLWRWNSIVALVLTVLVTLGLVAAVQAVRKTVDIVSTLIAVAVGLLVTLGPLVLHAG